MINLNDKIFYMRGVKVSESHSVVSFSLWPHGLYSPWNSPGQNTGVGGLSLLQGIFPPQERNRGLLHCRQILYQLSYQGVDVVYPTLELNPYVIGNFRKFEKTSFRKLGRLARQYLPGSIPSKGSVPAASSGTGSRLQLSAALARVCCPGFCPT